MSGQPAYTTLITKHADGILTIVLNRPEVFNAVNAAMKKELLDVFRAAERDASVRCVVLRGAGPKAFCAGQDLKEYQNADVSMKRILEEGYNPIIRQMRAMEKPIIGMINGVAAGAGFSLALACDLRIMSETAVLIQAFVRIGLVADSGSHWFLPRLVGTAKAFEYAATGRDIPAREAAEVGLVNHVVPAEALEQETLALARRLADGPPKAIGMIKRTLERTWSMSLDELLAYEALLQNVAAATDDHKEGVAAFLGKRKPVFTGK